MSTTTTATLEDLRIEFERAGGRTLAFPAAGMLAWIAAGILGAMLPTEPASYALFICNGLILPMGMAIAKWRGEDVMSATSDLDRLFGRSMVMVNLVWTIAIPFWLVMPSSLPLSIAVLSGLHWIVYGWIVQHWIGMFHAVTRAALTVACWFLFPGHRFVAIPIVVVTMYAITIYVLATRKLRV
jgi:hypothetical protein